MATAVFLAHNNQHQLHLSKLLGRKSGQSVLKPIVIAGYYLLLMALVLLYFPFISHSTPQYVHDTSPFLQYILHFTITLYQGKANYGPRLCGPNSTLKNMNLIYVSEISVAYFSIKLTFLT